jgi:hypothetical protein
MTDYNKWDKKANDVVKQIEQDDEREKVENDKALGLTDGPKGPPTEKAEKELKQLGSHSEEKQAIMDKMKGREVIITRKKPQEEPVVLEGGENSEIEMKGVRIQESRGCHFIIPKEVSVLKVFVEKCKDCKVSIQGQIMTSTVEIWQCAEVDVEIPMQLGVLQVDECDKGPVRIKFAGLENVQDIYHHNAPGLTVSWGMTVDNEPGSMEIGRPYEAGQQITRRVEGHSELLVTEPVRRDETNFPLTLRAPESKNAQRPGMTEQPEQEPVPKDVLDEQAKQQADAMREKGNEAFRNADFMQAAAHYSEALAIDEKNHTVWANRAQCWLKLGSHQKAVDDATKCTEICPSYAKGWFRKGIGFHAMGKYTQAIPALLEAEKLDPKNKQIVDAIKMAQLMARQHGGDKEE